MTHKVLIVINIVQISSSRFLKIQLLFKLQLLFFFKLTTEKQNEGGGSRVSQLMNAYVCKIVYYIT